MSLQRNLRDRRNLEGLITAFDSLEDMNARIANVKLIELPLWMRLTPYFLSNSEVSYGQFALTTEQNSHLDYSPSGTALLFPGTTKIMIRIGNTVFEHYLEKKDSRVLTAEKICFVADGDKSQAFATLHSVNGSTYAGQDSNVINKLGVIIYVDDEKFLQRRQFPRALSYDRKKFNVTSSSYELAITLKPSVRVTQENAGLLLAEIARISNEANRRLEAHYKIFPQYIKMP